MTMTTSNTTDVPAASESIGILGGTGPAGRGLAVRLAATGQQILIGSRDPSRAQEVAAKARDDWSAWNLGLCGTSNEEAAQADLVVMAAPWNGVLAMAPTLAELLKRKVVISMANALTRVGSTFMPLAVSRGSVAAELQAALPHSYVAGAFHHLPATELGDLDHPLDCDVLVVADDESTRNTVSALVTSMTGLRAIDAGTLAGASAVEAMTAVILQVNARYRTHAMLRLIGSFS